jgi:ferric-dicitrate binding protein FerR (iron transport regulator)
MTPNEDWTELSDAWTTPGRDDQGLAEMARQVRHRSRLGRLNFVFEMAGCLLAGVMGVWVLATRPEDQWLLGAAAVLFGLFGAAMTLWARGGPTPDDLVTPEQALFAAIRQAEAGRRWGQAGIAVTIAAAVFLGTAIATYPMDEGLIVLYSAGALFLFGSLAFYLRHQNRCARRITQHRRALEDLTT